MSELHTSHKEDLPSLSIRRPVLIIVLNLLIIIAGFPSAFISIFFTGSMLIEVMFSLEGIGLLGFESTIQRDYPVVFSSLYIMTLLGLVLSIISDLTYTWVDPRIDFEAR